MTLATFVCDIEGHPKCLLVRLSIRLVTGNERCSDCNGWSRAYLEAAEFELQVLLLIEQLLETVGQDDVRVV